MRVEYWFSAFINNFWKTQAKLCRYCQLEMAHCSAKAWEDTVDVSKIFFVSWILSAGALG